MKLRRLSRILAVAVFALLASCSDSPEPGTFCPTLDDQGPVLLEDGTYLLVANSLGEDWRAVDLVAPDVPLSERGLTGATPNDLDIIGDRLYTVNSGDNTITVVDLATSLTVGCINLGTGSNPWELRVDPSNPTRAWVTTFVSGELIELDLNTLSVVRRITVGPALEGLWVSATTVAVSVTGYRGTSGDFGDGTIVFFAKNTLTEIARHALPPNPQFLFTGADGRIHAVCSGDFSTTANAPQGRIVRVEADGSAVRDTLVLGGSPFKAALGPDGIAVVTAFFGGVMAYDTASFQPLHDATSPILPEPGYTAPLIVGDRVALANFDLDAVVWIRWGTWEVLGGFLVGDGPIALAATP